MRPRDFLNVAEGLASSRSEAARRTATGRAYYAALMECHEALARWGVKIKSEAGMHQKVQRCFDSARDRRLHSVWRALKRLVGLRQAADYLYGSHIFHDRQLASTAVHLAGHVIETIDLLEREGHLLEFAAADVTIRRAAKRYEALAESAGPEERMFFTGEAMPEEAEEIKAGDQVHLRSGSPRMTVESAGELCKCLWHDPVKGFQRIEVPAVTLRKYHGPQRQPPQKAPDAAPPAEQS
jgi:uncharacterized protein YodC (DUF2158 family)